MGRLKEWTRQVLLMDRLGDLLGHIGLEQVPSNAYNLRLRPLGGSKEEYELTYFYRNPTSGETETGMVTVSAEQANRLMEGWNRRVV